MSVFLGASVEEAKASYAVERAPSSVDVLGPATAAGESRNDAARAVMAHALERAMRHPDRTTRARAMAVCIEPVMRALADLEAFDHEANK